MIIDVRAETVTFTNGIGEAKTTFDVLRDYGNVEYDRMVSRHGIPYKDLQMASVIVHELDRQYANLQALRWGVYELTWRMSE